MQKYNSIEEYYPRPRTNGWIKFYEWSLSNPIKPSVLGVIILLTGTVTCETLFVLNDFRYTAGSVLAETYTIAFGSFVWMIFFFRIFCVDCVFRFGVGWFFRLELPFAKSDGNGWVFM